MDTMPKAGKHLGKAAALGLVSMLFASTCSAGTIGQNRCMALDRQLSDIRQTTKVSAPQAVGELAVKAEALCSEGKAAQGLRVYAKALKILGRQPVFPSEQQPNQNSQRIRS
jgi:hypothetical protein